MVTFRLAVDRDFKNKDGEREADFINVMAWRSAAEFVYRFFTKGRMAVVDGRLQVRNYTDRDGSKRTASEVVAGSVYFGDSRPAEGCNAADHGTEEAQGFSEIEDDGETPF